MHPREIVTERVDVHYALEQKQLVAKLILKTLHVTAVACVQHVRIYAEDPVDLVAPLLQSRKRNEKNAIIIALVRLFCSCSG